MQDPVTTRIMEWDARPPGPLKLADLPAEVLRNIVKHVPRKTIFLLQRASRQFFFLVTAELYSHLDFQFTTIDAKDYDTPATRFSDALQSIITSDYNYAQHIRRFGLGISQENPANALMMARFLWGSDLETSKTLNTSLLQLVSKATGLETFAWYVPVELNGRVYQALHAIPTLRDLGMFLGENSVNMTFQQTYGNNALPPNNHGGGYPAHVVAGTVLSATPGTVNSQGNGPGSLKRPSSKSNGRYDYWGDRRPLSKFSRLNELKLKEIADLDCLDEIAGCLRASSATLKHLTLSLSFELASKSRKPSTANPVVEDVSEADETQSEDDQPLPPVIDQPIQGPSAADARKDRIAQESILAKVFSLQAVASEGRKLERKLTLSKDPITHENKLLEKLQSLAPLLEKIEQAKAGQALSDPMVKHLTAKVNNYIAVLDTCSDPYFKPSTPKKSLSASGSSDSSSSTVPIQSPPSTAPPPYALSGSSAMPGLWSTHASQTTDNLSVPPGFTPEAWSMLPPDHKQAFINKIQATTAKIKAALQSQPIQPVMPKDFSSGPLTSEKPQTLDSNPPTEPEAQWELKDIEEDGMDIDMEHPDESALDIGPDREMGDDENNDESGDDEDDASPHTSLSPRVTPRKRARLGSLLSLAHPATEEPSKVHPEPRKGKERENVDSANAMVGLVDASTKSEESMQQYIRATHGLRIETFALYLIPLKASVVARALDLSVLRHITLLDVGSQSSFWLLLQRQIKDHPLIGFETIHMDDVSHAFLGFLSATNIKAKELYLLRRKERSSDTHIMTTSIDASTMFNIGFRKHVKTLTHLMIRNEQDDTWDLNEQLVRMLSLKCSGMVELGVSMKTKALHTLTQHITRFTSLRVLHFVALRTTSTPPHLASAFGDDTVSFVSDAMSYFPKRKLRYIAVGERCATVESPAEIKKRCKNLAKEHKKMQKQKARSKKSGQDFRINEDEDSWDEMGFEHKEAKASEAQLKWNTKFWEVKDAKIFEKVKRTGKLN